MAGTSQNQAQKGLNGEPLTNSGAGPAAIPQSEERGDHIDGNDATVPAPAENSYSDAYEAEAGPLSNSAGAVEEVVSGPPPPPYSGLAAVAKKESSKEPFWKRRCFLLLSIVLLIVIIVVIATVLGLMLSRKHGDRLVMTPHVFTR